jgi:hypothetical protein
MDSGQPLRDFRNDESGYLLTGDKVRWAGASSCHHSGARRICELRCAIAHRRIHLDELLCFKRSQECLRLFTRREAAYLDVVRVVFRGAWRTKCDKVATIPLNNFSQIVTMNGGRVSSTAMRAVVITHAGPGVRPILATTIAGVMVEKPGHANPLRSQTIIAPRNEINETAIT